MIRISNLKKRFERHFVLDIPELHFEKGKLHILVGHNGSGKTTLLKIINGLENPTTGQIENPFTRQEMVLCHQKPYMFQGSVEKNVFYGIKNRKQNERQNADKEIIERLKLFSLFNRDAKSLSAGEMQRVALARALLVHPKLLLLDEPTANLDPESIQALEEEIMQFQKNGKTAIMATHRVEQAYHLSDHVKRLEKGTIVAPEIENIFEGEIFSDGKETCLKIDDQLQFSVATEKKGLIRIAIPPMDIILSKEKLQSSMRNSFSGRITALKEKKKAVEVSIDIGKNLKALITPASLHEMELAIGTKVYASFKATAIKVF